MFAIVEKGKKNECTSEAQRTRIKEVLLHNRKLCVLPFSDCCMSISLELSRRAE